MSSSQGQIADCKSQIQLVVFDLGRVLIHAIEAQEYDTALRIIEREWSSLLATSPVVLVQAANSFPP